MVNFFTKNINIILYNNLAFLREINNTKTDFCVFLKKVESISRNHDIFTLKNKELKRNIYFTSFKKDNFLKYTKCKKQFFHYYFTENFIVLNKHSNIIKSDHPVDFDYNSNIKLIFGKTKKKHFQEKIQKEFYSSRIINSGV